MNREIKFRVWDKNRKMWVENDGLSYNEGRWFETFRDIEDYTPFDDTDIEVVQYLGRKDEDDREIYEEYIVSVIEQGHRMGYYYEDEFIGVVKYDEEQCTFKLELIKFERGGEPIPDEIDGIPISHEDDSEITEYWFGEHIIEADIKILGNTFENPELLKGPTNAENE